MLEFVVMMMLVRFDWLVVGVYFLVIELKNYWSLNGRVMNWMMKHLRYWISFFWIEKWLPVVELMVVMV